jgi:hypothetical protein
MFDEAVQSYRLAWHFAQRHLGNKDGITQNLKNVYERAKGDIHKQLSRTRE